MHDVIDRERLHNALILVVDDAEINRKVLSHSLNSQGYNNVVIAEDGSQALQMTHDLKPDLVILDLMMPSMDGFAYCKAVRQNQSFSNMPIIVQTVLDDMEQKLKAFQTGASDYICKPINPSELVARTNVHLNQRFLVEDLRAYRARISADLDAARDMQNRLMPGHPQIEMCERVFNMKIASHFETSSALGGDCWGMHPLSNHRLGVYVFDFAGHGTSAALNVFRMHTIMQECLQIAGDPGNFLSLLNQRLHPLLGRDEFATMFYGIIDTEADCLQYASAATPPALVFAKTAKDPMMLDGRGFPIGVVANAAYDTKMIPFMSSDMLLLYSDSIIETKNSAGKFLSDTQVSETAQRTLAANPKNPAVEAVDALLHLLRKHNPQPMLDDLTISAYWRCPKAAGKH